MLSTWHLFFKSLDYILLLQANYLEFHESTSMDLRIHKYSFKYEKLLKHTELAVLQDKKGPYKCWAPSAQRYYAISNIIRYALAWQFMKASKAMFISWVRPCTVYTVQGVHLLCNTHAKLHLKYEYCTFIWIRIVVILLYLFHICIK